MSTSLLNALCGSYRVNRILGEDRYCDYAVVSHSDRSDVPYCLAAIKERYATDKTFIHRFAKQYEILKGLKHKSIPKAIKYGDIKGRPCMIAEWVDGQRVSDLVNQNARFNRLNMFIAMCNVTSYLHGQGIVHNQISPHAFQLRRGDGRLFLTSYLNLATVGRKGLLSTIFVRRGSGGLNPEQEGAFCAPELHQGKSGTYRSDCYSLGACGYLLLGEESKDHGLKERTRALESSQRKRTAERRWGNVPKPIVDLIDQCLRPSPEGRPDDAGYLRDTLREFVTGQQQQMNSGRFPTVAGS